MFLLDTVIISELLKKRSELIISKVRGRGSSMRKISAIRPVRGDMAITRSASNAASGMLCVTSSAVYLLSDY